MSDQRTDREDRLRMRAYALWEGEGRPHGRAAAHWSQAEREAGGMAEEGERWSREAPAESYSEPEQPGASAADPASGMPEANAQAGEGAPRSGARHPSAASPDEGPEDDAARGTVADIPVDRGRRGSRTEP